MKIFNNEKAVTPVIGVMLMIVVTVILAAAVSSYAGSMQSQDAAPQATFKVSACAGDELVTINHLGGDTLTKASTKIELAHGSPVTSGYVDMSNVTFAPNADYLRPGDMATIPMVTGSYGMEFKGPEISMALAIGTPFRLTIIDTETGQTVYSTSTIMNP